MSGLKRGRAGGMMSSQTIDRVEELRQAGLARVRAEEYEQALAIYDEALSIASTDEKRELITINKADAMIALDRSGPEVQQLPAILMRRRNLHHAFLAAYALMFKHRMKSETKRGIFYGELALNIASEAGEPVWKLGALNDLGIHYEMDSKFDKAIECFEQALALIGARETTEEQFGKNAIIQNLGYNKLLVGQTVEGITLLLSVIDKVNAQHTRADAYIDL